MSGILDDISTSVKIQDSLMMRKRRDIGMVKTTMKQRQEVQVWRARKARMRGLTLKEYRRFWRKSRLRFDSVWTDYGGHCICNYWFLARSLTTSGYGIPSLYATRDMWLRSIEGVLGSSEGYCRDYVAALMKGR